MITNDLSDGFSVIEHTLAVNKVVALVEGNASAEFCSHGARRRGEDERQGNQGGCSVHVGL